MAKADFIIRPISKQECVPILKNYHYLTGISKGFKSGYNFGLFVDDEVAGVCIFTGFPVAELAKGMYGLDRSDQAGLFELSRLCLSPSVQKQEHNICSWFVSRAIRQLKKQTNVRSILSYADSEYHQGTIYRACNFKYYGLTDKKKDFWIKTGDSYVKHSRGKIKGLNGEWRERSRKHRFVITYDKTLNMKWSECKCLN
tara:strand:- start:17871 stop:18467 length:597 start_codon:yes stop_codon:yes gene_type:complete